MGVQLICEYALEAIKEMIVPVNYNFIQVCISLSAFYIDVVAGPLYGLLWEVRIFKLYSFKSQHFKL